jgi:hypothetical protein
MQHARVAPTIGRCVCGAKVYMSESFIGLTQCECGRWYFIDGTELLPSIDEEKEINCNG